MFSSDIDLGAFQLMAFFAARFWRILLHIFPICQNIQNFPFTFSSFLYSRYGTEYVHSTKNFTFQFVAVLTINK
jgi:hypothetical protein